METLWFCLVAAMLTTYVVLDGFDLGAGILHLFIAKTPEERSTVIRTIGPVWDGNEVWLVVAGAVGNTIDRVRFGAVVDFLDFHVGALHWPAFNIADSAIVIGACLILLDSFGVSWARHKLGRGEG